MDKSSDQEASCLHQQCVPEVYNLYSSPIGGSNNAAKNDQAGGASDRSNTVISIQPVIEIKGRQSFTHEEASRVLPIVLRITKVYSQKVDALIERLDAMGGADTDLALSLEAQADRLIQEWQSKIQKLGALPKGIWIADFDAGDGYFCWKYPERSLEYWHRYNDGFSRRVLVTERAKLLDRGERSALQAETISEAVAKTATKQKIFSLTPVK